MISEKIPSRYITPALHIIVWGLLMALPHIITGSWRAPVGPLPNSFWFISSFIHIGIFYANAYLLYPRLLTRRRWPLYPLAVIAVLGIVYLLKMLILYAFYSGVRVDASTRPMIFFSTFVFLVASIVYRLVVDKIRYEKMQKEKQAEQLSMELKFLRSQISPHFLFNVLANLVALARKKSEKMEPALIMLSDLMRYMLYGAAEKKVPLEQEVAYLKSYIALQQLRFGNDTPIETGIEVADDQQQLLIEPMLLIPFVENAFKHGIGWIDSPFISIQLKAQNHTLHFEVKNRFNAEDDTSKDSSSGIGLANVQTRLRLLYPHQHSLVIKEDPPVFSVTLTLHLS